MEVLDQKALSKIVENGIYDSDLKDAAVIDFSIRGDVNYDSYGSAVLRIAVRESILHEKGKSYTDKSNPAKSLPTYTLNRRLTPKYNLNPRMKGRVELTIEDIETAAKNPPLFLKSKKIRRKKQGAKTSLDLDKGLFQADDDATNLSKSS